MAALNALNDFLYTWILVVLLAAAGIYFTVRTRGAQFRLLDDAFRTLGGKDSQNGLTRFQAMLVSTASRVGTGNIIGVSSAIAVGGPGSIFWMWIMALLGAASALMESILAQLYKTKDGDTYRGGPAYYIQRGMGLRWLGIVYSILLALCTGFGWNTTTSYNISAAFDYYVKDYYDGIGPQIVGVILVILMALVIFGGIRRIGSIASLLVPVMAVIYILFSLVCVFTNLGRIPAVFALIFRDAFDFRAIAGGFAGSCIVQGVKRGLFSNEAGMGTGPNVAATAECAHPVEAGLGQVLSVFLDTLVICTATSMIILTSNMEPTAALAGSPLVQQAVSSSFGTIGMHIVTVSLLLFAFTTMLGNYYYAEVSVRYITQNKTTLLLFRIASLLVVFVGTDVSFDTAWLFTDILMALVAIVNIVAVLSMSRRAVSALRDYDQKRGTGKLSFRAADIGVKDTEFWK